MTASFQLCATTLHNLEPFLAKELKELGARDIQAQKGAVVFRGEQSLIYRANLCSRMAIRVLKQLKSFSPRDEKDIYRQVKMVDWSEYLDSKGTLVVDAIVRNSRFTHSLYVAQLVKDAIVDQFRERVGIRPTVERNNPDLRINIYINGDRAILSLDSSGASLHKRGYRIETNAVPLNEVLAAGIIRHSGWDGKTNFIDPMCGSGTFLIEAAMLACNRIPGYYRKQFGFMRWKDYRPELLEDLRQKAQQNEISPQVTILGSDVNKKNKRCALTNVKHAGLNQLIRIEHKAFEEQTPPPAPGVLVMNPPYGKRQEAWDMIPKYQMIGDTLKEKYSGYTAWVFTGNPVAAKHIGLRPSRRIVLFNGSAECRLLKFDMYQGSRKHKQ